MLALLKVPQTPIRRTLDAEHTAHPVRSAVHDMREGFRPHGAHTVARATLLFASLMVLVMMGPLGVLIPFLVKDELGGGPTDHAYVLAGSASAARWGRSSWPRCGCRAATSR